MSKEFLTWVDDLRRKTAPMTFLKPEKAQTLHDDSKEVRVTLFHRVNDLGYDFKSVINPLRPRKDGTWHQFAADHYWLWISTTEFRLSEEDLNNPDNYV